MRNQSKMTPPKDHNHLLLMNLYTMEIYDLPDKEIKIATLRKLNKLSGNTKKLYTEIKKKNPQAK